MRTPPRWLLVLALLAPYGAEPEPRGYVISAGTLTFADHEIASGYVSIGEATVMLHPDGEPIKYVQELRGRKVELVIREVKDRKLEELGR